MKTERLYTRQEMIDILDLYTKFLQKEGYIDSDATQEEPTAIDQFLKSKPFNSLPEPEGLKELHEDRYWGATCACTEEERRGETLCCNNCGLPATKIANVEPEAIAAPEPNLKA